MKKSILITGATSGIGLAAVKLFSKNEYTAFATYRKEHDRNTLLQIQNVNPIKMDVTSGVEIENAFRLIAEAVVSEGLYAIINNAGITYTAPLGFADEQRARQTMEVNVMAPYKITKAFIPLLKSTTAKIQLKQGL